MGYLDGMGMLIGPVSGHNFGAPVSSPGTWNSAWNFGRSLLGYQGLTIEEGNMMRLNIITPTIALMLALPLAGCVDSVALDFPPDESLITWPNEVNTRIGLLVQEDTVCPVNISVTA